MYSSNLWKISLQSPAPNSQLLAGRSLPRTFSNFRTIGVRELDSARCKGADICLKQKELQHHQFDGKASQPRRYLHHLLALVPIPWTSRLFPTRHRSPSSLRPTSILPRRRQYQCLKICFCHVHFNLLLTLSSRSQGQFLPQSMYHTVKTYLRPVTNGF